MIKVENIDYYGWGAAIRGMRNPMNSWAKSDSYGECPDEGTERWCGVPVIGPNDLDLMRRLYKGGTEHRKFARQIFVSMDITAPLYWWKEFDTYKVGTTANSCSTMHKIQDKEFTLEDFSCEHLIFDRQIPEEEYDNAVGAAFDEVNDRYCGLDRTLCDYNTFPGDVLESCIIPFLNRARDLYLKTKSKRYWWQMIQLLPSSYNQMRTVTMTYENVFAIRKQRKGHKLDEWNEFCDVLGELPYVALIENGNIV